MSPVWMIEGTRKLDQVTEATRKLNQVTERSLAERRFAALAAAVREHEAKVRRREYAMRGQDSELYRRLRQICGDVRY